MGGSEVVGHVNNALFVLLAIFGWRRWRKTSSSPAIYAALTFTVLALIVVVGELTPEDAEGTLWEWVGKATIAILLLFPYFLHRFATSFVGGAPRFDAFATAITAAIAVWTLFLPPFPEPGEPRSPTFVAYLFALLGVWTVLSVSAAIRLWRAGRGQPGVARRRMRLLALAALALNIALLVAGLAPSEGASSLALLTQILALAAALMFFLGLEPPGALRVAWRRREEQAFRDAVREAVSARNVEEMTSSLLPTIAAIVGARSVSLLDHAGESLTTYEVEDGRSEGNGQEIRLALPDGYLVVVASSYTPFFGDDEVRLAEFLGSLVNIALQRIRLSRLQELILKTAGEGIYGIGRDGRLIFLNPAGAEMLGWTEAELVGQDMHALSHHSHPDGTSYPKSDCPIYGGLQTGQAYRSDTEVFWRKDGTAFPVEYISAPIREGDAITGMVVTFTDITQRKLSEAASALAYEREREARMVVEKTNQEMESFVYIVSHDLNSPLVSVSGYLEYLKSDYGELLPDQGRFFIDRMKASASYMQTLIRDLLEFSRVGRVETETASVDLAELLPVIVDEVVSARPQLQVTVEDLPVVSMNPSRAHQLFANLLNNAARYAGPEPHVDIRVIDDVDGRVVLSVRDNGPGIPKEQHQRAFEVFQRLQERQSEDGTGIGLAICKRIVESAGGEIWLADSQQGADFRMTLPLTAPTSVRDEHV